MKLKKALKYFLFVVLLVGIGFLQSFSLHKNSSKKVSKIQVQFDNEKTLFLTQDMVNKLLIQNEESPTNKAKSDLDLHNLEQKITENPYVDEASVFVTLDGELQTNVIERIPIARFISSDSAFYIDDKGFKMPLSEHFTPRVILVSGVQSEEEVKSMTSLLAKIEHDPFLKKELIGIAMLPNKELVFSVRSGEHTIEFGDLSEAEIKFNKLKAFYNKSFTQDKMSNYKNINLKYNNQVVCTKHETYGR